MSNGRNLQEAIDGLTRITETQYEDLNRVSDALGVERYTGGVTDIVDAIETLQSRAMIALSGATFQERVQPWLIDCFGPTIAADRIERNHRFFEEATELVQACGMTRSEAYQLVDYVFGRAVGEPHQEVGGVMVTLAALCLANDLNMHADGDVELNRISVPETVAKIRAKQAAKPKHSPLPELPRRPRHWNPVYNTDPWQRASKELPEGWELRLCVEKEAGWVEIRDPQGNEVPFDEDADTVEWRIHKAIDAACQKDGAA